MQVIANIEKYANISSNDTTQILRRLLADLISEFNESVDDPGSNIRTTLGDLITALHGGGATYAGNTVTIPAGATVMGRTNPHTLTAIVADWNQSIRNELVNSIEQLMHELLQSMGSTAAPLRLDTTTTYELKKAATTANGDFSNTANVATYMPSESGELYFRTVLTDYDIQQIVSHPENYVVLELSVS